jgi:hypothetical protein
MIYDTSQVVGALRVIRDRRLGTELLSGRMDRGGSGLLQGPLLLSAEQPVAQSLPPASGHLPN